MKALGVLSSMLILTAAASAQVVTEAVAYKHGDVSLEGFLAYDKSVSGKRPAVLIVHEWWGLNDFAKDRARRLAEMGYVAFAVDMYGKGVQTSDPAEAGKLAGQFKENRQLMRDRAKAGYDALAANERVDRSRIAAIGFCFGGTTVLQMAYSGLDLAGVVSLHGGLVAPQDADTGKIKAKLLVLHGAEDSLVPEEQVAAFRDGLRKANADWRLIYYGGAKHSFTNPASTALKMDGVGYDEKTERRSFAQMRLFFDEVIPLNAGAAAK